MEWKGLWTYVGQLIPGSSRGDSTDGEEEYKDAPKPGKPRRVRRRARVRARGKEKGDGFKVSGGPEGSSPARSVYLVSHSDSDSDSEDPDDEEVEEDDRNRREERREDRDNNNDDGESEHEDDENEEQETDEAASSSSSSLMCQSEDDTDTEVEEKSAEESGKEVEENHEAQIRKEPGNISHTLHDTSSRENTAGAPNEDIKGNCSNAEGNYTDEAGAVTTGDDNRELAADEGRKAVIKEDKSELEAGERKESVAGRERKGDCNLHVREEARKSDEEAESDETKREQGVSYGKEETETKDAGKGTDYEASKASRPQARANDKTNEKEKGTKSENEDREDGSRIKHTTDMNKGGTKSGQRSGEKDRQRDTIDEKEGSKIQDEKNSVHVTREGKEPPGNENEETCGQPETAPQESTGRMLLLAKDDAATEEDRHKNLMKGLEDAEGKESERDLTLNRDESPKEDGGANDITEENTARREKDDNFTDTPNATQTEEDEPNKTHKEKNAAISGAAAAQDKTGTRLKGGEQRESRGKEGTDDGTNCEAVDVGVAQVESPDNPKRKEILESKIPSTALISDSSEGKTLNESNSEVLESSETREPQPTSNRNSETDKSIDRNIQYETPGEDVELKETKHTQETHHSRPDGEQESDNKHDNIDRDAAIKRESKNTEGRTIEGAGAIKKCISSHTREGKGGGEASNRNKDKESNGSEKKKEKGEVMKNKRTQGTEEEQPNTTLSGGEGLTQPGNSLNNPAEASREREQDGTREAAADIINDDKARAGEEEEEEDEEKKDGEEENAEEITEVKKETPSENGEKEGSDSGVVGGALGVGAGGGGKRRRRKRKTRGGNKKEMESEKERDSASQNPEASQDDQTRGPDRTISSEISNDKDDANKNTSFNLEDSKTSGKADDKRESLNKEGGTEVANKTELEKNQQPTACIGDEGADNEEASLSSVRQGKTTKGEAGTRPRGAAMNGAPQFSDVAKQIMKEVQETRNRRNKCLRDLRSMKPKAARIYIAKRHKEKVPETERENSHQALLGEDTPEGLKGEESLMLSPIPEVTSPNLPQDSPKNQMDANADKADQDGAAFVFSSDEQRKAQMSKPVQESSPLPPSDTKEERHEKEEKGKKSANRLTPEKKIRKLSPSFDVPEETTASFSASSSSSSPSSTTKKGEKVTGLTQKEVSSVISSPPLLVLPSEGTSAKPDSGDTLTKNSSGTEVEVTGGRTQQCLVAAGCVRVCGSAPSTTTTTTATKPSRFSPAYLRSQDATHGKVENSLTFASDEIDGNGNIDDGGAVQGDRLLRKTENIPPKVVGVKHKSGVRTGLEPLSPCSPPHSAVTGESVITLPTAPNPEQEVKKTNTRKNKREGQQTLPNSSEVSDNADNESKEKGDKKLNIQKQGTIEVEEKENTKTLMRQGDGKETDALEGPWATPQLARVVQELVVSRKFNMSSSQAKKRQQNITRLDAQQKDRTLIFDSSRLHKSEGKNDSPSEPQNETSKNTHGHNQSQKSATKSVSKITGRKNRRGSGNGEQLAQSNQTKKGRQGPLESKAVEEKEGRQFDPSGPHEQKKTQIEENLLEDAKTKGVQGEERIGNINEACEASKREESNGKSLENDDALQPPLLIQQLSRSPQHPRVRLRKVVENLTLIHNQSSPRSSPQPGSPAFNSSLNTSPRIPETSPRSTPGVSPSPLSPRTRAFKGVALSPRLMEAVSPQGVEIVDSSATDTAQDGDSRQQYPEGRTPSSGAPRETAEARDEGNTSVPPRKNREGELLSPLRKTPTRNEAPTELIFNFMKLPEITTDQSTKKDQKLESGPRVKFSTGPDQAREELSETSKPSARKLDSDIIQFFESQQHKPREIVRNETVITEHLKGTKLRPGSDRKSRGNASVSQSKGSTYDIEPGRRDRTFSDPMDKSPRESRNSGKLRSVKSFDDSSAVKSASDEESEEEVETPRLRKEGITPEQSSGKDEASKTPKGILTSESRGKEVNEQRYVRTSSVTSINEGKVEVRTDTAQDQQPIHSPLDKLLGKEEQKRNFVAVTSGSQHVKTQDGVSLSTKEEDPKQGESRPNTTSQRIDLIHGAKKQDESNSPTSTGVSVSLDSTSTVHREREKCPETTHSASRRAGATSFMAVVQELQEKAGGGVGRMRKMECEGDVPLQDDRFTEVANTRFTTSPVHQITPTPPPLPLSPESSLGFTSHIGSPESNPNLEKLNKTLKPVTSLDEHQQELNDGFKDTASDTEIMVKYAEETEGAKSGSRDSVTFHLTLVGTDGKRERDQGINPPEPSPKSVVIKKRMQRTAVDSDTRSGTFLETCVDDIEPHQQQQGSLFSNQEAPRSKVTESVVGIISIKGDIKEEENTEKEYGFVQVTETTNTVNPGGGGGTEETAGRGGTIASHRLPRSHRRLTKTISEGSFAPDQQGTDTTDSPNENLAKPPRPPSLLRSRTESEFSSERLASAAAVDSEPSTKTSTVSEIFARGVYGRLKAKSRSADNIRMSSLSCVEIPFPPEPPALPAAAAPYSTAFPSSSSCRIVGVLRKKHSADDVLDSRSRRMDSQLIRINGSSQAKPKAEQHPFAVKSCDKDQEAPQDTAAEERKPRNSPPPLESTKRDTTTHQQIQDVKKETISSVPLSENTGKSSPSENQSPETPIYQNIPEALQYQNKTEAMPVKSSQPSQTKEEPQQKSITDQKKTPQKVIHIYENVPIVAGKNPQDEAPLIESPKKIIQPIPEGSVTGNELSKSSGSSSWPSTSSPISDIFFPSKRATFEKTSLRRKQQPESESRIEKQKSNYMKQRAVRVGILKKQKSDITGVRLQKLHYFDTELPGELRRSYSLSGSGVQNKEPRSPKNSPEDDAGPESPDTDAKQRGEGKEELNDLERRCHSSISNTSRSSTIDRILQSCAPCISNNTTSSTLDLSSSPLPRSQSPQKKLGFYSGGGTAGRPYRRQHPRTKHPYKSSYSSPDVTLLSSGASSVASQEARSGKQPTRAAQEESFKPPHHECSAASEQEPRATDTNSSQDTGSTSGLASSETSSSIDESANGNKHKMKDNCDRDSCTPTPEQSGALNSDTDFYSELLDTILSVVDAHEQSSGEAENLCFSGEVENLCSSKDRTSQLTEEQNKQTHDNENKKNDKDRPNAVTSDSDSTTSVDSELAEVRRRITERFPPVPRADPEASQESVLASPSAVCPMPDCAACRTTNFSEPLMFAFDQPITPPVLCEAERAASLPFVDHTISSSSNDHFTRSTSLPHDPDIYHSTQVMCRHEQDEEEYWSAGEETSRGTPQGTPRHQAGFQGHLPQHLKHQSKLVALRNEPSSPEGSITKVSSLHDSSPPDSSPLTDSGVEIKDHSELTSNQLVEEVSQLRLENEKLSARNRSLQSEVDELRRVKENMVEEDLTLKPKINEMTVELTHAKEALSALKADRKRLKAEKFDLLNQMKQLYATLEDKEKELRDFIRNYEQRMKDSDESLRHLAAERDETEREKWNILKHARDESERVVKLSAQLGLKEATVKKLQEELDMVRKQLNSVGYYSDAESVRTNGLPTPTASTPTCSPLPVATPTPTPNGRGSSADSGVRLSSDRESTASHDGGPGTPKESPSLSPLYATPAYCRAGEDQLGGGDKTPTTVQTPAPMSGLANSSANAGGLSRSAEQLCERLSETGEISKAQGTSTLMRKNHKSGGTWGSISRVFARQKKRAALDTSIYDGSGSDKRASWSPSSSLCASPLTEESYSEKLRLLEEAQHIPLERWKAPTVLAWLEVTLGMAQYGAMCAENVRSGKVLLELSDSELEAGLGITHPMHRKKLRLAIEELREPRLTRYPRISALGHTWVSSEWLPDLGLPQYSENFANSLVDGRLLEALTKKELEKHLGVHRKFHQASIIHGVHLLRIVRFDRQVLAERRRQCELVDADPVVWTNLRWVRWARSIDLAEYADNLKDSGVHGALVVLEPSFTADTMATALGIPQSKNIIRRHLATELESLVNPARQQLDEQARYAKMERRRQEKLASGGSLGRSFSRSYGTGLEKGDKDKRRASLRGSLSRALGLRLREEAASVGSTNGGGESSSSGGQSPAVTTRAHPRHGPHTRPRSSIMPSQAYFHHETHRRVKSIGDIETITVTPV